MVLFVRCNRLCRCDRIRERTVVEEAMPAAAIFVGVVATLCVVLAALLLQYETVMDLMTDFALAGVLLGLAAFVSVTAARMVKSNRPPD